MLLQRKDVKDAIQKLSGLIQEETLLLAKNLDLTQLDAAVIERKG
jgi:hypothetical protein